MAGANDLCIFFFWGVLCRHELNWSRLSANRDSFDPTGVEVVYALAECVHFLILFCFLASVVDRGCNTLYDKPEWWCALTLSY